MATIPVATSRDALWEPMVFVSLVAQAPVTLPPERRPPLEHAGKRRTVTGVTLRQPLKGSLSPGIRWLVEHALFAIEDAPGDYLLELEWDGGQDGQAHDFRPDLPLVVRW